MAQGPAAESSGAARPDGVPPLPADTAKGAADVWLSPWAPGEVGAIPTFLIWQVNEITLYFDAPVHVALMRIANYSKTPARGVQARGRCAEISRRDMRREITPRSHATPYPPSRRLSLGVHLLAFISRRIHLGVYLGVYLAGVRAPRR